MSSSFWSRLEELVETSELILDRPKGSAHPRDPSVIYPLDYGYLAGTSGGDGNEIDVWRGSLQDARVDAVVCTTDLVKRDAEVKVLLGCSPAEKTLICRFHQSHGMGALLVERQAQRRSLGQRRMIRLESASPNPPPGLAELLADLGAGENGFSGTPVHTGEATLQEYLQQCCDMPDRSKLKPGLVPQTVFWVLNTDGEAIGMVRLRHYLIDKLRVHGGHCGYFIRRDHRGKGYGKTMLSLALAELRSLGEKRALITTDPGNLPSIRVIEANGGQFSDVSTDPETGAKYRRYWIDLEPQQPPERDK